MQWTDATPAFLRQDIKADYLRMTLDSYTVNKDASAGEDPLGTAWVRMLTSYSHHLQLETKNISSGDLAAFARIVNANLTSGAPVEPERPQHGDSTTVPGTGGETTLPEVTTATPEKSGASSILPVALGLFCVLTPGTRIYCLLLLPEKGKFPSLRRKQDVRQ